MTDALQQHMRGTDQATIENKLTPKEIGWNETIRQGVYKHLNGITFDVIPTEFTLGRIDPGLAGADKIGVDSSGFVLLAGTTDQDLWDELDAFLTGDAFIRTDGSEAYTGNQSFGNNDILDLFSITGETGSGLTININANELLTVNAGASLTEILFLIDQSTNSVFRVSNGLVPLFKVQGNTANPEVILGDESGTLIHPVVMAGRPSITQVTSGLVASTTQTQGQAQLTKILNEVATVANANDVVTLPEVQSFYASKEGGLLLLKNNGANALQVFPAAGDGIDSLAPNTSISIPLGEGRTMFAVNSSTWITL